MKIVQIFEISTKSCTCANIERIPTTAIKAATVSEVKCIT